MTPTPLRPLSTLAATLLVLAAAPWAVSCSAPPAEAEFEPVATDLRVATFNIRYGTAREDDPRDDWPNRREHVVETIRALDPDVLGVQEALHAQVVFLEERLEGYARVGQGRGGGERDEYAAVFYRDARLELLDHGDFWLSETPDVVASKGWDAAVTRMATWAELRDRASGRAFRVWNTHFDHRGEVARERSSALIGARVAASSLPDLVLGDLNADEDSPALVALRASGLRDTFRDVHPGATRVGTFGAFVGERDGPKIDYVLRDEGFETIAASIDRRQFDGRDPSDHFPVTATVRLPGR